MPRAPVDHLRSHAAAAGLAAAAAEFSSAHLTEQEAPLLHVMRVIAGDDAYGAAAGLVVQGDGVGWASVSGLVDLAVYGSLAHRRLAHPAGAAGGDCELCTAGEAMWHNSLIHQVVSDHGTTATRLHQRLRTAVELEAGTRSVQLG